MASVRQTTHTTMSTTNPTNHDNNLDALLEELQTSVSRPGSSLGMNGNAVVTGYREVTRTVMKESLGQPVANSSAYQIEYLNPANSTTVISETLGGGPKRDVGLLKQSDISGRNVGAAYKTLSYEYRTSETQDSSIVPPVIPPPPAVSDARMRQNITELDSLLDDLHTAQKTGFADTGSSSVSTRHTTGIDSGLIEPMESSTPRGGHVSRSVEKRSFQEQRYGSVGRASPSREKEVRRELIFTGGSKRDQPSPTPIQQHKEMYRYESKTSSRSGGNVRDLSPPQDRRQPSPSPVRGLTSSSPSGRNNVRTYNYSSVDQDVPRTPTMHRSPSPAGGRNTSSTSVRTYNYSNQDNYSPDRSRQPPVVHSQSPSATKVTAIHNYNNYVNSQDPPPRNPPPPPAKIINSYSYSRESRETSSKTSQDVPRSPPPHRSPSPVSFAQPPLPVTKTSTTVKTYNFDQPTRSQSPQPGQKFSPSDPSRTLTYQVSPPPHQPSQPTVITYKYSSHTSQSSKYPGEEGAPLLPRPFPTPSPTPDQQQQQPPKKLDELMASFSDTEIQHHHETSNRYMGPREPYPEPHIPAAAPAPAPETSQPTPISGPAATAAAMQVKSKNIAGPPVYYPPGVELFAKKEECMMQQQSGGGMMKAKAKAKYEYEASSKSKEKSSSGKSVVPVCLPLCCAMPCVIM